MNRDATDSGIHSGQRRFLGRAQPNKQRDEQQEGAVDEAHQTKPNGDRPADGSGNLSRAAEVQPCFLGGT